jgi:hypothetical protein
VSAFEHAARLQALRKELERIYADDGYAGMFNEARRAALRNGVDGLAELVYAVYSVAADAGDDEAVAAAIAQYAMTALRYDELAPEGISEPQRCAHIAVMTLLDFQGPDRWRWDEPPQLHFATWATVSEVKDPGDDWPDPVLPPTPRV